jgi:hypothetical protein
MFNFKQILFLMVFGCFFQSGFSQVGINTTTPLSTLDINGNLNVKEIGIANALVAGSATLNGGTFAAKTQINDGVYISIMPIGSTNDFELPNAVDVPGRIYIVRNISNSNYAFIYSSGGLFFPKNSSTANAIPLEMQHSGFRKTLIFVSDGLNWTFFE